MKMCNLLDRYRDGELQGAERDSFQRHLDQCPECKLHLTLLDNIVVTLRQETAPVTDLADRIVRQAFQRVPSWDELLASWFQPRYALAAGGLTIILCAFLWFAPASQPSAFTEYEALLSQADSSNLAGQLLSVNENDFAMTLVQGGMRE